MTHWRKMMDRAFIYEEDLNGKDVAVRIDRVVEKAVKSEGGKSNRRPVAYFGGKYADELGWNRAGEEKGLALNPTNCKTIASIVGSDDVDRWLGKWITLFPARTTFGGKKDVPCVRVRPTAPKRESVQGAPHPPATPRATPSSAEDDGR